MNELNALIKSNQTLQHIYNNLRVQLEKLQRHARQCSYATRTRYFYAMLLFLKFLAVVFKLEKISNISGKHLCAYLEWRQDCGIAPATIKSELCAVRYYHDMMPRARHPIPDNDALSVNLERRRFGKENRTWTEDEYRAFCAIARDESQERYDDLFVLAHDMGLRIHESHKIDTAIARDALRRSMITIKGKGGKVREVPTTAACEDIFRRKLKEVLPGEKLFVHEGQKSHTAILALQTFIIQNRDRVRDKNNPVALTYHGLRHTYAANKYAELKNKGLSDFDVHIIVSRLLGHERAEITDIYLVGYVEGWDNIST